MERLVTLIGGAGFVGAALTETLARKGYRIRVLARNMAKTHRLRPLADLGQIGFVHGDVLEPRTLAAAMRGADAVVNLAGILTGSASALQDVHVKGAGNVAAAASASGARALVHVSAIGARRDSPSLYGRTKAAGEDAVRQTFPGAAIVRPSIIFGPEDSFTNRFATIMARAPILPVIAPEARLQPVYVGDVAQGIAAILDRLLGSGAEPVWEFGGPDVLTLREIFAYIARATGRERLLVDTPGFGARLLSTMSFLPGMQVSRDEIAMLSEGSVVSGQFPGLADLGIPLTPMAGIADDWLVRFRSGGRFSATAA